MADDQDLHAFPMPNLGRLKTLALASAAQVLDEHDRLYELTVRIGFLEGRSAAEAADSASSLLTEHFDPQSRLLSAIFDVELGQVKLTVGCSFTTGNSISAGLGREAYLRDSFILHFQALVERVDKMVALVFRRMLSSMESSETRTYLDQIRRLIFEHLRTPLADERNALAHGGDMTVAAMSNYWASMLALREYLNTSDPMRSLILGALVTSEEEFAVREQRQRDLVKQVFGTIDVIAGFLVLCIELQRSDATGGSE